MVFRLPNRLRDPFTALLLFGAAGILAMIVAFAITSLPRLGPPTSSVGGNTHPVASPVYTQSPTPLPPSDQGPGRGHGKKGGG